MVDSVVLGAEVIEVGKEEDFSIDETAVDSELCSVGSKLCFYGNLAADLKAQAATKKAELEQWDSELAIELRNTLDKVTEGIIKEKTKANQRHKELTIELIKAEKDFQKVENLFRSQQKRADCVISLSYKQRTEINKY